MTLMLVKMYTLYTKLSYMKTGHLEVRDHKGRLKVLIYMTRPSLGGSWATYKWSYILLYLLWSTVAAAMHVWLPKCGSMSAVS